MVYIAQVANLAVTELLAALLAPKPVALLAATRNVYAVPQVRPVTVSGEADPVAVKQPGVEITR